MKTETERKLDAVYQVTSRWLIAQPQVCAFGWLVSNVKSGQMVNTTNLKKLETD